MSVQLALDVGGTKLAAGVVEHGRVTRPVRVPTPSGHPGVWDACARLLVQVADGRRVDAVAIASAGPVDTTAGTVAPINIPEWADGFAITDAAGGLFRGAHVQLVGDGAATALGEHRHGAGRGTRDLLAVVVSTGVGAGLVLGGRPVFGRTGNAGHLGHVVVHGEDSPCTCGGRGCLETVASGPASVRWARERGWPGETGIDLARDDGDLATAALARAGTALGEAFASAAALLDVDLVVVGGGFSAAGPRLWQPMREAARLHARLSFTRPLRIVPAELGGDASLAGAAVLATGQPLP
ncbi:ROK family protein [Rhodococcus sp. HNM0569]|uniref:ROK family protein n=1 Tax=Rhodococcus sp. HNM0569 TaxID=2716340 RepID=UPI0014699F89|nr:ROK family protein [Rhodococcus sp. HNM0569]NLU83702.1 ROK family protein [Rhodococcus sp. HNM0569]